MLWDLADVSLILWYLEAVLANRFHALVTSMLLVQVDFMRLASYGSSAESSGNVRTILDLSKDIAGEQNRATSLCANSCRALQTYLSTQADCAILTPFFPIKCGSAC